ncbi:MAG: hypothetical protein Kow009_05080 [Spirochaetales bacterium]
MMRFHQDDQIDEEENEETIAGKMEDRIRQLYRNLFNGQPPAGGIHRSDVERNSPDP